MWQELGYPSSCSFSLPVFYLARRYIWRYWPSPEGISRDDESRRVPRILRSCVKIILGCEPRFSSRMGSVYPRGFVSAPWSQLRRAGFLIHVRHGTSACSSSSWIQGKSSCWRDAALCILRFRMHLWARKSWLRGCPFSRCSPRESRQGGTQVPLGTRCGSPGWTQGSKPYPWGYGSSIPAMHIMENVNNSKKWDLCRMQSLHICTLIL